jgi:hypothetical protein
MLGGFLVEVEDAVVVGISYIVGGAADVEIG